jgi:uncharacterized membrane protein
VAFVASIFTVIFTEETGLKRARNGIPNAGHLLHKNRCNMNAAEGLRRIAKGVGYLGFVPLGLVIYDIVYAMASGRRWPGDSLLNIFFALLLLAVFQGVAWVILGFTAPKRTDGS